MQFDFTTVYDRHGQDAVAVDSPPGTPKEGFSLIPMWVADMSFPTAPAIVEAIQKRLQHPIFGYYNYTPEYYGSILEWHRKRNGVEGMEWHHIGYENGVLGCASAAAQAFTAPGEALLIHAPTYVGFTGVLGGIGRKLVHSQLVQDEQGVWRMDFEDMDRKIKEHHIHFAVFCSPHNPCGRVWERWEIEKAMEVYAANDVVVVSDEIWSDLILPGHKHIPTQSVSEDAKMRTIAVYAPSKTFGLAGIVGSYHVVYNPYLRDRLRKQSGLSHYNSMNVLSMHALIGAYSPQGQAWVDECVQVLGQNVDYTCAYIKEHFQGVTFGKPQGTYMLYLDCEGWCKAHGKTMDELLKAGWDVGVIWQDGRPFHRPYGIRLNVAVPMTMLQDAMDRLNKYVFNCE